jgi:F-box/leucine-rich repeat protein 10/11
MMICFQTKQLTIGQFLEAAEARGADDPPMNVIDYDIRHRQPPNVRLPSGVVDISLGHRVRPADVPLDLDPTAGVSDYLLMGQAGSVTDFHQDFSGTSVFYYVLGGHKRFFLVFPSPQNTQAFKEWAEWTDTQQKNVDRTES